MWGYIDLHFEKKYTCGWFQKYYTGALRGLGYGQEIGVCGRRFRYEKKQSLEI